MTEKDKGTTLWIHNDTRLRMSNFRKRGVSYDRFINDMMDIVYQRKIPSFHRKNHASTPRKR